MTSITKSLNSAITFVMSWLALEAARFIKFSVAIGAHHALSVVTIIAPFLGGGSQGMGNIIGASVGRALCFSYLFGMTFGYALALQLPLLAAVIFYHSSSRMVNVFFFLISIVLFVTNPVGGYAWLYAMLWLIPCGALMASSGTLATRALTSTFAAHAVGSLVCLYSGALTASMWVALIPAAFIERMILALGLFAMAQVVSYVRGHSYEFKSLFALIK